MLRTAIAIPLLAAIAGCQPATPVTGVPPRPVSVSPSLKPADVKIDIGDVKTLERYLAAHKGENVVFVDYWATWCEPCVEYFPHTVELSRKFKDRGLATITVSFDDPAAEAIVRDFLSKHGADCQNLLSSYELGPAAFDAFGIDQVPHFRLYDRQGQLRHKWDAKPDDGEQKIEALLAETIDSKPDTAQ